MKKILNKDIEVFHSENIDDIKSKIKLEYPFEEKLLKLLKKENKLKQEYYYIKKKKDFAFFVLYKNKMNIFTFGKLKCYLNLNVIGYSCSLSNSGYITNNEEFFLNYIKTLKGAKLVLNVSNPVNVKDITIGETLPTCVLNNNFQSIEKYINSFRSSYRRRINNAINKCKDIKIEVNSPKYNIYDLYLNTYNKSNYKLEKLEKGFFEKVDGTILIYIKDDKPIGFTLLKKYKNKLIFMLCGMDYKYETADLYYYMLYNIVKYAIENNCDYIDFGQTSEETKMKFGAKLEKRYFYAHHSNPILNCVLKHIKGILEYKYKFSEYRVFKEEIK